MIQAWLARMWAYVAAVGAAALVIFGFYANAKRKGAMQEREKHNEAEIERIDAAAVAKVEQAQEVAAVHNEKVGNANEALNEVNAMPSGDAANELRNEWSRD
jgi:hypothetical protein